MALAPPAGPGVPSEPLDHPPGAPREPAIDGCTVCPAAEEERSRPQQAQVSLDPPECTGGGLKGTQPTTSPQRPPVASSHEHPAGGKLHEHPVPGTEVPEAEQDSLHLCLLGLGLQLQDLEQGLGPWTLAHSRMVQLQALQAELRGAAERVDALLAFGEGLAQRSEPRTWASLEQILRALAAHRDTIFRRLWQLQAQLVSYSLVFEKANMLDQDLEIEGDSDGPGSGGAWGPWTPSNLPTPAELEWDPAGDVGGLGPSGQKLCRIPGAPCELCGHKGFQGSGQGLEDIFTLGLSHRKHLVGHRRHSLLRKPQVSRWHQPLHSLLTGVPSPGEGAGLRPGDSRPSAKADFVGLGRGLRDLIGQGWVTCPIMELGHTDLTLQVQNKKRQASPSLPDVMLEVDPGVSTPASKWLLAFLLLLFLLVGAVLLWSMSSGPCCSGARLARTPYLVLSYVNGPPPI